MSCIDNNQRKQVLGKEDKLSVFCNTNSFELYKFSRNDSTLMEIRYGSLSLLMPVHYEADLTTFLLLKDSSYNEKYCYGKDSVLFFVLYDPSISYYSLIRVQKNGQELYSNKLIFSNRKNFFLSVDSECFYNSNFDLNGNGEIKANFECYQYKDTVPTKKLTFIVNSDTFSINKFLLPDNGDSSLKIFNNIINILK
ncbi:MAG: hypothetical protein F9K23_03470 [Bacteroidetes bacterium]|nr:MAG: hypothetical protein F9K23_03470 [Bacteroidota bacterium]